MSFISSTQNLLNAIKKLPNLAQSYYASGLQIHIKESNGDDLLSFEIQAEDFAPVAISLVNALSKRLLMRKALLETEIKLIDGEFSKEVSIMRDELLEVLYDSPEKYPEVLVYLNLNISSEEEFSKHNDYDYREFVTDELRARLERSPDEIKYLYQKFVVGS